ncbi:hypothetical protein [Alloalcanivorax profundimaris]|uniref:hypothetical protein n=1 Tax=Alloalcanivorax profundimaris TaxID=2735259 RepID=UPI0018894B2A|nr:hypothetical protein [Alloalcanivorax profundimaris]MBF1801860.1 hypothetical protein [Alloalcanivorax profundimaris]
MDTLTPSDLALLLIGCALLSSLVTLVAVGLAVKFWLGPRLERHIDARFEAGADRLTERFVAVLTGKSRDLIRDRARDLARFVGGRRPREEEDGQE